MSSRTLGLAGVSASDSRVRRKRAQEEQQKIWSGFHGCFFLEGLVFLRPLSSEGSLALVCYLVRSILRMRMDRNET